MFLSFSCLMMKISLEMRIFMPKRVKNSLCVRVLLKKEGSFFAVCVKISTFARRLLSTGPKMVWVLRTKIRL